MQKFLSKLKDRFEDTHGSSDHHTEPIPHGTDRFLGPFPSEADLYRYRKQRGVNLGSWFVLERWITESPFRCARDPGQSDLDVAKGENAKDILEHHWDTWVTEADWAWIAERGINTVRIPIGYYHLCAIDPSVLYGTDFSGLDAVFSNAWTKITNALATAHRYGIGVLFDLHAAPGKQNRDSHSGTSLEPSFFKHKENMKHTIHILTTLVTHITSFAKSHNPPLPNLVGVELLNEPSPGSHNEELKRWYRSAFHAIREIDPDLPMYISDSWMTNGYAAFIKNCNIPFLVLDHHLYRCFTSDDISTPAAEHARRLRDRNEDTPTTFARVAGELEGAGGGLVIGEWSAALNPGSLHGADDERQEKRAYVEAQLQLYEEHCAGWFFWTYKKESTDSGWSFRDAIGAGVFPSEFRKKGGPPAEHDTERDERKEKARDSALGEHTSYWTQHPGHYEHWRFSDGFTAGWDDAILFMSWATAHQYVEELGFKGPWMRRRADEHIVRKGNGNIWEFQHGFVQGYKAALAQSI